MKQVSMSFLKNYKKDFGGSLLAGKRKGRGPISTRSPMHLVLKSNLKGVFSPSNRSLEKRTRQMAQKFHVRIYDLALVPAPAPGPTLSVHL